MNGWSGIFWYKIFIMKKLWTCEYAWFPFNLFFKRNISFPKKKGKNWSAETDQQDLNIGCRTICAQAAYRCDCFARKEFAEKTANMTVDNLQWTKTSSVN